MSFEDDTGPEPEGPSAAALAGIEAEWPLIEAEVWLLDAQITILCASESGPSELDWQRLRRARRRVLREARALLARGGPAGRVVA